MFYLLSERCHVTTCSSYLVEICVLSGGEPEAALLGLKVQEAGQQSFSYVQVIAIEPGGGLGDVTQLVGKFLLHNGAELCLIPFQRVKLNKQTRSIIQYLTPVNIFWGDIPPRGHTNDTQHTVL